MTKQDFKIETYGKNGKDMILAVIGLRRVFISEDETCAEIRITPTDIPRLKKAIADYERRQRAEAVKQERERAEKFQKLAADMWGILAAVKKENTREFWDYFHLRMTEFTERHESLRNPQPPASSPSCKKD